MQKTETPKESKVLLLGNGIYRAFHGEEESWDSVLRFLKKRFERHGLEIKMDPSQFKSGILFFEYLYVTWKRFREKNEICFNDDKKTTNETTEWRTFSKKIQEFLKERYDSDEYTVYSNVINKMVWSHFDVVLTTNVDNRLERKMEYGPKDDDDLPEIDLENFKQERNRQWKYSTFRRKTNKDGKKIFYMHGSLDKDTSLCFGLDHYLGEYRCQYDCLYEPKEASSPKKKILWRLEGEKNSVEHDIDDDYENSWLNYFFFHDVDIVGQGLNREELDIWWALEKRYHYKHLRKMDNVVKSDADNRICYFYPSCASDESDAKVELLRALDVVPVVIPCSTYREFYKIYFDEFAGDNTKGG